MGVLVVHGTTAIPKDGAGIVGKHPHHVAPLIGSHAANEPLAAKPLPQHTHLPRIRSILGMTQQVFAPKPALRYTRLGHKNSCRPPTTRCANLLTRTRRRAARISAEGPMLL